MTSVHVLMRVGDELYALPVDRVVEVAELDDLTPVPGAPAAVLGVRDLRGQVLPIVDLATLLGIRHDAPPKRLVVGEDGVRRAGLAIDEVTDVGPLPAATEETTSELLTGGVLVDGALVGVLDIARVFEAIEARRSP